MSMLKKELYKYRNKLLFNKIKTVILFVFCILWLFSPGFLVLLLPESAFVLGWLCIIAIYFNFRLSSDENFIANKWFNKLKTEREELRYAILEEKNMIRKVENIKILPLGKK